MRDDAFETTWAVWSGVGFELGLVVFGASLLFFIILDCTVGRLIKGRGQNTGSARYMPADNRDGPESTGDSGYDGSGGTDG